MDGDGVQAMVKLNSRGSALILIVLCVAGVGVYLSTLSGVVAVGQRSYINDSFRVDSDNLFDYLTFLIQTPTGCNTTFGGKTPLPTAADGSQIGKVAGTTIASFLDLNGNSAATVPGTYGRASIKRLELYDLGNTIAGSVNPTHYMALYLETVAKAGSTGAYTNTIYFYANTAGGKITQCDISAYSLGLADVAIAPVTGPNYTGSVMVLQLGYGIYTAPYPAGNNKNLVFGAGTITGSGCIPPFTADESAFSFQSPTTVPLIPFVQNQDGSGNYTNCVTTAGTVNWQYDSYKTWQPQ